MCCLSLLRLCLLLSMLLCMCCSVFVSLGVFLCLLGVR